MGDISRADFIHVLGTMADPRNWLATKLLSKEAKTESNGSQILNTFKPASETFGFEPLPDYRESNLVKFDINKPEDCALGMVVDLKKFPDLRRHGGETVEKVIWLSQSSSETNSSTNFDDARKAPITSETVLCKLTNGPSLIFFSSKDHSPQGVDLYVNPDNNPKIEVLADNCFKFYESGNVDQYFFWDGLNYQRIDPPPKITPPKYHSSEFDNRFSLNTSTPLNNKDLDFETTEVVVDSNCRVVGFSLAQDTTRIHEWTNGYFRNIATLSYNETSMYFSESYYIPPVICFDNSIGYISLDQIYPRMESLSFIASLKIIDNNRTVLTIPLKDSTKNLGLLYSQNLEILSTTNKEDIRNFQNLNGGQKNITGVFYVSILDDKDKSIKYPWIIIKKNKDGNLITEEVDLPEKILNSIPSFPHHFIPQHLETHDSA